MNFLEKTCNACGERKTVGEFYWLKRDGWTKECKPCHSTRATAWQRANPEKNREAHARHKAKDPERVRAQGREQKRAEYKTPAGRASASVGCHRRRALILDAYSPDADARIRELKSSTNQCYICGVWLPSEDVTIDHVIPLARGGRHTATNLDPACSYCNKSKGARSLEEVLA